MRCILFDLDGTLIDSAALYGECMRVALGWTPGEPLPIEPTTKARPASELAFLIDHLGEEAGSKAHQVMCEVYEARASELLGGYFAGVLELLGELETRGTAMGIVTGKSKRAYEATLRHVDLARFFDVVILEDDVRAPKPDPHGILQALERLGFDSHESVYVGDTRMDIEAAHGAGMIGAAALWSRPAEEHARLAARLAPEVWPLFTPADLIARLTT